MAAMDCGPCCCSCLVDEDTGAPAVVAVGASTLIEIGDRGLAAVSVVVAALKAM